MMKHDNSARDEARRIFHNPELTIFQVWLWPVNIPNPSTFFLPNQPLVGAYLPKVRLWGFVNPALDRRFREIVQ